MTLTYDENRAAAVFAEVWRQIAEPRPTLPPKPTAKKSARGKPSSDVDARRGAEAAIGVRRKGGKVDG